MKKLAALTLSMFLVSGTAFADTPKNADPQPAKAAQPAKPKAAKKADKSDAAISAQLEELREALQSQQEQLQMLKEELAKRDRQIDEAREAAASANARAAEANTKATEAVSTTAEVKSSAVALNSTVSDLKASNEVLKTTVATEQADAKKAEETGPTTIKFKGVNITPGGFIAAETVFRNRATSGDIPTAFTGIPYPGNPLSKVTENNFSARASRLTLLVDTKLGDVKVTGYYEADFNGVGTASNDRQTNSYVFRQRQLWAQVATPGGLSFTGGQMWSLATENKKGIDVRGEAIPLTIDVNYNVGFTFDRAYAARLVKSFGGKWTVALAIEGPQSTFGGRGFSTYTTAAGVASQNFFINAPGAGGGLFNAFDPVGYSINKAPEFVVKVAADPGFGHYEVFGIVSEFRNRVYPCAVVSDIAPGVVGTTTYTGPQIGCAAAPGALTPSSAGAFNDSRTGGGGGASARISVLNKKLDIGVKALGGDGIARYGAAQLVDLTFRPDGTQALIKGYQGLGAIEFHPTPKLDAYFYYGGEYAKRAGYTGYNSVKVTTTSLTGAGPGAPLQTATTVARSITGAGGYGGPTASNAACGTEGVPTGSSAPVSGACAGDIRYIGEGSVGFWYKFYQGPKGGLRFGMQYSYIGKNAWSGAASIQPKANDNVFFTSFRYYLP